MTKASGDGFDFPAFKRAFVTQDVATWAGFFAEHGEWFEYRHANPPSSPSVIAGRDRIAQKLDRVKACNVRLEIEDELVGPGRAAFRVWVHLEGGKRILEQVFIYFDHGRITRQIDVEAWD
jgi:hypothetical protein